MLSSDPEKSASLFIVHKKIQITPKTTKAAEKRFVQILGCEYETSVRFETKVVDGETTKMILYCFSDSDDDSSQPYAFYKKSTGSSADFVSIKRSVEQKCYTGQLQIEFKKTNDSDFTMGCSVQEAS